jgi:hypothetical protein
MKNGGYKKLSLLEGEFFYIIVTCYMPNWFFVSLIFTRPRT